MHLRVPVVSRSSFWFLVLAYQPPFCLMVTPCFSSPLATLSFFLRRSAGVSAGCSCNGTSLPICEFHASTSSRRQRNLLPFAPTGIGKSREPRRESIVQRFSVDRLIRKCRDTSAAVKIASFMAQNQVRQQVQELRNNGISCVSMSRDDTVSSATPFNFSNKKNGSSPKPKNSENNSKPTIALPATP